MAFNTWAVSMMPRPARPEVVTAVLSNFDTPVPMLPVRRSRDRTLSDEYPASSYGMRNMLTWHAFVALGACESTRFASAIDQDGGAQCDYVGGMYDYVYYGCALVQHASDMEFEGQGCIEYDVFETFGAWLTAYVADHGGVWPSREDACEHLCMRMVNFYGGHDHVRDELEAV